MPESNPPRTKASDSPPEAWHSRGYLPHFDQPDVIQSITFRVADSLPAAVLASLAREAEHNDDAARYARIEEYLNAGYGACHLRDPRIAGLVQDALLCFDEERYRLIAWVIMPNHVHVLIETIEGYPLSGILHSWKSYTAKEANWLLERSGPFWFPDYFDRFIRNEDHFIRAVHYVHDNPVKAGLAGHPEDWLFGSARCFDGLG